MLGDILVVTWKGENIRGKTGIIIGKKKRPKKRGSEYNFFSHEFPRSRGPDFGVFGL